MKVITKYVNIENEEFYLIKDSHEGKTYYGTINYKDVDENGKLKRQLNGFQMCIADTVEEALARRERDIKTSKEIERLISLGMDREEAIIQAVMSI